jgi:hypothetical protein
MTSTSTATTGLRKHKAMNFQVVVTSANVNKWDMVMWWILASVLLGSGILVSWLMHITCVMNWKMRVPAGRW